MIFGNLIWGGFGILMSNMSQVQTILWFQGCDKMVLQLHTAGTENPDNPKHIRVPPISMNIPLTPPNTLGGVCGVSDGYLGVSEWHSWKLKALGCVLGYLGSQSLQYGAVTPFCHNPETKE